MSVFFTIKCHTSLLDHADLQQMYSSFHYVIYMYLVKSAVKWLNAKSKTFQEQRDNIFTLRVLSAYLPVKAQCSEAESRQGQWDMSLLLGHHFSSWRAVGLSSALRGETCEWGQKLQQKAHLHTFCASLQSSHMHLDAWERIPAYLLFCGN